jgi:GR25 family glycosyltransferase involved in LPS biosynthesis
MWERIALLWLPLVAAAVLAMSGNARIWSPDHLVRAYVINLDRSPHRWTSFRTQYDASDLAIVPLHRVAAVDGQGLPETQLRRALTTEALHHLRRAEATGHRQAHHEVTLGAVGCYLSHLRALELVSRQTQPIAVIFEDDTALPSNAYALFRQALACAEHTPWDMLLMGCRCMQCNDDKRCSRQFGKLKRVHHFILMHAYAVTPGSATKILRLLRGRRISQQLDHEISCLAAAGEVNVLCDEDAGFTQLSGKFTSHIQVPVNELGMQIVRPHCAGRPQYPHVAS